MKTFTFLAPKGHKLVLDRDKPDEVIHGGEQFEVSNERAKELLRDFPNTLREEGDQDDGNPHAEAKGAGHHGKGHEASSEPTHEPEE